MRRSLPLFLPLVLALVCGCRQIISLMAARLAPPQKVEPKYTPPSGKTTLVFVDDPFYQLNYEPIKGMLTDRLNKQLTEHGVVARTIPFQNMLNLVAATPDFNRLSVSEVGKKLGADLVLYVKIDRFSLKDDEVSPLWQGRFGATVRMVGVPGAKRLWPTDRREGYTVETVELSAMEDPSPQYGYQVAKALADAMADRIAKLFYEHTVPVAQERPKPFAMSMGFPGG